MSPSKEPEVEEEEKTTPEDSPLLLALESYPDFEDSENRIILITPGSQTSLHTPSHNTRTSPTLASPTRTAQPQTNPPTPSHNTRTSPTTEPLTPTQRPRATSRRVGGRYEGRILDDDGYLVTEAVQDL